MEVPQDEQGLDPMSEFIEITEPTLILSISVLYPDIEPEIYEATRYAWIVNGSRGNSTNWCWRAGGIW